MKLSQSLMKNSVLDRHEVKIVSNSHNVYRFGKVLSSIPRAPASITNRKQFAIVSRDCFSLDGTRGCLSSRIT